MALECGYHIGDCRTLLPQIPDDSIDCCVTSPPYWGLRSYTPDQVRLRSDLTESEKAHVLAELAALGIAPIGQ